MLREMTSAEITEWRAFNEIEPFGAQLEDLRTANLMALIANVMAPSKDRTWEALDFMPDWDGSVEEARGDRLVEKMRGFQERLAERLANRGNKREPILEREELR
jgi:hypothetical protein